MNWNRIIISLLVLSSIVFAGKKHKLDLFVMSKCPYGTKSETQIFNLISQHPELTRKIDIEIHYILDYDKETNKFRSLHGQNEVDEDVRQILIRKYYPDKFWCYVSSKNSHFDDTLWMDDAEICGIGVKKITKYMKGKGSDLAIDEAHLTDSLNVSASPTIFLDGVEIRDWMGDFPTLYKILTNSLANSISSMKCQKDIECPPKAGYITDCADGKCKYNKAPLVKLTIISLDTTKYGSSPFGLAKILNDETGNLKVTYIPYGDEKSKTMMNKISNSMNTGEFRSSSSDFSLSKGDKNPKINFDVLPIYMISREIDKYPGFKRFGKYLLDCSLDGDSIYVVDPSSYLINAMLDRPAENGSVDLFVMSKCPFSQALEETLLAKNFGDLNIDNITFNYVVDYDESSGKFESFHGIGELAEDRRQLIIQKYYPEKIWDYIHCHNTSNNSDSCILSVNLNPDDINEKMRRHSDSLLIADAKISKKLNIHSTPTVFIDNRYILSRSTDIQKFFNILLNSGQCGR